MARSRRKRARPPARRAVAARPPAAAPAAERTLPDLRRWALVGVVAATVPALLAILLPAILRTAAVPLIALVAFSASCVVLDLPAWRRHSQRQMLVTAAVAAASFGGARVAVLLVAAFLAAAGFVLTARRGRGFASALALGAGAGFSWAGVTPEWVYALVLGVAWPALGLALVLARPVPPPRSAPAPQGGGP